MLQPCPEAVAAVGMASMLQPCPAAVVAVELASVPPPCPAHPRASSEQEAGAGMEAWPQAHRRTLPQPGSRMRARQTARAQLALSGEVLAAPVVTAPLPTLVLPQVTPGSIRGGGSIQGRRSDSSSRFGCKGALCRRHLRAA